MNRFQYEVFNKISFSSSGNGGPGLDSLDVNTDIIKLTQNENYNIVDYYLLLAYEGISKIEYFVCDEWHECEELKVQISFLNKIQKIRISFKNNIVDPITFNMDYVDADKDAYDAKMYRENIKEITKEINFKLLPAVDFINVIFKKVSKEYSFSKIELYYLYEEENKNEKEYQLLETIDIKGNKYYHTIEKLSLGSYAVRLIQYAQNNVTLFTSDYVLFNVRSYSGAHYSYDLVNKG